MSLRNAASLLALVLIAPSLGCGPDLRETIETHKQGVEVTISQVKAIATKAKSAPPVTNDALKISGIGPRIPGNSPNEEADSAVEYLEDLENILDFGNIPNRMDGAGTINRCAAALTTHREPYDPTRGGVPNEVSWYEANNLFKHCKAVRYLFVIRSLAYAAPSTRSTLGSCVTVSESSAPSTSSAEGQLDAGVADAGPADAGAKPTVASKWVPKNPKTPLSSAVDAGASDAGDSDGGSSDAGAPRASTIAQTCKQYDGGYLKAEVLVYDMKTGAQAGGFQFVAESSASIDFGASSTPVETDFKRNIRQAFIKSAQSLVSDIGVGF